MYDQDEQQVYVMPDPIVYSLKNIADLKEQPDFPLDLSVVQEQVVTKKRKKDLSYSRCVVQ